MSEEEINYWLEEFEENRRMYMSKNHKILSFYETFKDMKKLKQENTQLKSALKEIREYCEFGRKEWITDDGFVEEVLGDVLEIIDKGIGGNDG